MILVSACLLGECCKYNGGHNKNRAVLAYLQGQEYLPVCPEALGGLPIPRPPAEIVGEQVLDENGRDITEQFNAGAQATLALAKQHGASLAILKERSPSCGVNAIYDGSFSGKTTAGRGITAALLAQAGIELKSEERF